MPKSNDESLCRHWKLNTVPLSLSCSQNPDPSFIPLFSEQRFHPPLLFLFSSQHPRVLHFSRVFFVVVVNGGLNPNAPLYVSLVHNYGLHLPVYSFNYFHEYPLYPSNKSWWLSRVTYLQHPPLPPPPPPPTRCQYYQHVNEMQEKDARTVNVNVINVKSKEIKAKGKRSRQSKGTKVKAAAAAAKEPEKDIQEAGVLLSKKTTTLMIRNLPNKFDQEKVLDLLDELYLPIDFRF
ncbi:uncharacterized protein LOC109839386 [Asparagus officinalis]|uniref:uncharacterized protein LOC109839386 n=1 Tax=Asparagus officinalis TaxID=4686 RepID=UPI00098E74D9|nr:uncharacterized protein LOC109839386 [Asparagus officinalis]